MHGSCPGTSRPLFSKRYEKGSTLLTSNKAFTEWGQVFGDDALATAIIDRLLHHCELLAVNGRSYRLKDRLAALEGGAASTAGRPPITYTAFRTCHNIRTRTPTRAEGAA